MTCHQKNLQETLSAKVRGRKAKTLCFMGKLHDVEEGNMLGFEDRTKQHGKQMKNERIARAKLDNCPNFNSL